jgi:hypothetical protein
LSARRFFPAILNMTCSTSKNDPAGKAPAGSWLLYAAVIGGGALLAITSRSLWIDEAWTARVAQQPTLRDWWHELIGEKVTDLQMPLYSLWIWGCEKLFGSTEFALRAVNLLWFVPALLVMIRALRTRRQFQTAAFMTAALSPFAWYYLNEARSYVMQLSAALVVYAAVVRLAEGPLPGTRPERRWVLVLAVGMVLLCGSSLLAMFLAMIPLLALWVLLPRPRGLVMLRSHWGIWLGLAAVLAGLAGYYLWTLSLGARATAIAGTDWRNPLFVFYELAGAGGLGPGRAAIRDDGLGAFKAYAPGLLLYAGVAGGLAVAAWGELRRLGWRKALLLTASVMMPVAILFAASHVRHFRILGRHFAALAPVVFLLFASGVAAAWRRGLPGRAMVLGFFALSLFSALSLRFCARHEKDDYRTAARLALAALGRGESVWWNADIKAAAYYHVPLMNETAGGSRGASYWMNPSPGTLVDVQRPDWVFCSRREVYDGAGIMAEYLGENRHQKSTNFPGFVVWHNPLR